MRMRGSLALLVTGLLLLVALPAWAGENKVTILCSPDPAWCEAVKREFSKSTGIQAEFVRLSSGAGLARLRAEKANPNFDVWFGGSGDGYWVAQADGLLEFFHPKAWNELRPQLTKAVDGHYIPLYSGIHGFGVNEKILQEKNLPVPTLQVVREDDDGVVISGMKMLATSAVFCDEIWIGNLLPLAPDQVKQAINDLYTHHPDINSFVVQSVTYSPETRDKVLKICSEGGLAASDQEREGQKVLACAPLIFFFYYYGQQNSVPESVGVARQLYWYALTDKSGDSKKVLTELLRSWGVP